MTDGPAMTLPGSRALQGWWRDLRPAGPLRMWYAHPIITRIEALAEVAGLPPVDALARALATVLASTRAMTPGGLAGTLGVPLPLVESLLRTLVDNGLARQVGDELFLTAVGEEQARARGEKPLRMERRVFRFLGREFVALVSAVPFVPPADWRAGLEPLEQAIARPAEWKARHGFPLDVQRILRPPTEVSPQDWPMVPLAAAEQATLVVVECGSLGGVVHAHTVVPEGWVMTREVAWELPSVRELEEVFGAVPHSAWREAWHAWCQQRNLPAAEVEVCEVEQVGHRLKVRAPAKLVDRLRHERSDAVKGEAWLVAGAGQLRGLARIEFVGD